MMTKNVKYFANGYCKIEWKGARNTSHNIVQWHASGISQYGTKVCDSEYKKISEKISPSAFQYNYETGPSVSGISVGASVGKTPMGSRNLTIFKGRKVSKRPRFWRVIYPKAYKGK